MLTAVIALWIVVLRLQRSWRERNDRRFQQRWRPLLMRAMVGEPEANLPPLRRGDRWRFIKLWNHLQASVRGEATQRLAAIAYRLGCDDTARRMLTSRRFTRRLFATLTLGHMRDHTAWDLLVQQLLQPGRVSSLHAARALIQIDAPQGARTIVPHLLQRDDWEMVRVALLLQAFRDPLGAELTRVLPKLPQDRLPRALQLAEVLHLHLPPAVLHPWLVPDRPEDLLVAALRLASSAQLLPAVRQLAPHPDWRVRVQVARALGRLGERADQAVLTGMLSDPQWWVRYRAARALARLPGVNREQLRDRLGELQDRYAREISRQVFAELTETPR